MTDIFTAEKRSSIMRQVKGRNTKPEMLVRRFLHSLGFRFRVYDKKLPCHPDIVLKKYKVVIFVNGCFWHGHENCKYFRLPKSNVEFWKNKIQTNIKRDEFCNKQLKALGWRVIVIWECELKGEKKQETLTQLVESLYGCMKS
jgi:DNA mismatch endonuclease (patch repair protein)